MNSYNIKTLAATCRFKISNMSVSETRSEESAKDCSVGDAESIAAQQNKCKLTGLGVQKGPTTVRTGTQIISNQTDSGVCLRKSPKPFRTEKHMNMDSGVCTDSTRTDRKIDIQFESDEQNFVHACRNGDIERVKTLVESGNVNLQQCKDTKHKDTPLHWAAYYGHLNVVKYLVENSNCDVTCTNIFGNTPLHRAAEGKPGSEDVVRYLIQERKCDPACQGQYDRTPLHKACKKRNLETVKYLMDNTSTDTYVLSESKHGYTPLDIAAQHGTLDLVKYMIENKQCYQPQNPQSEKQYTLLHFAAYGGNLPIVKYLIEENHCSADVRGRWNRTPLHSACLKGNLDVVKYLVIERGVDPSCEEDNGETPLHSAAIGGNIAVVRLLVQTYMCDPQKKDKKGQTPLDLAQKNKHVGGVEYFQKEVKAFADVLKHIVVPLKQYKKRIQHTGNVIGRGAFSEVIEVSTGGKEILAGKIFNSSQHLTHTKLIGVKLVKEIEIIMRIHHPHIVQCKGVGYLENCSMPVLLMERLNYSVHDYLLRSENLTTISVKQKLSILHDTASGLDYLHNTCKPAIIHRDLTAKNVLLDSKLKAKIADFGNSRVIELEPDISPQTMTCVPGTLHYMPPEAQVMHETNYDPSLDIFSFGHFALFTFVQRSLILPTPTYIDHPSSNRLYSRSEVKRRKEYIDVAMKMMSKNLLVLIKQCLHNSPPQRPKTSDLLNTLQQPGVSISVNTGPVVELDECATILEEPENTHLKSEISEVIIRGADIAATITLTVHSDALLNYDWKDYGLKVQVPPGAVLSTTEMIIQASTSGQYELPPDVELVSGIYWISFPKQLLKPATLSLQHCCVLENSEQVSTLQFFTAKCSQKKLPYKFELIDNGSFSVHSSYGSIEVDHFSGFGLGNRKVNKQYLAQIYTIQKHNTVWNIEIPVTKDLQIFKEKILNEYKEKGGDPGPHIQIPASMVGNELCLNDTNWTVSPPNMPNQTCTDTSVPTTGWNVTPLATVKLLKKTIESYKEGAGIPTFQLQYSWAEENTAKPLQHKLTFHNLEDFLMVTIFPKSIEENILKETEKLPLDKEPTLPILFHFQVPQQIGAHYEKFGINLLNDATGSYTRGICSGREANQATERILGEWLEGKGLPVTWQSFSKALKDTGLFKLKTKLGLPD